MHPKAPSIERGLRITVAFQKVASELEPEDQVEAQERIAAACDELFTSLVSAAAIPTGASPTEKAAGVMTFVLEMRNTLSSSGQKTAASPELALESAVKLATAIYVDEVVSGQLPNLAGEAKVSALRTRLLGREFAVSLLSNLLT